jgi:GxxExxY protein
MAEEPGFPIRATAAELNQVTGAIIAGSMKVHSRLGPGLLEVVYHTCLVHELRKAGLRVESNVWLPIVYDGVSLDAGFRLDLLVEDEVILFVPSSASSASSALN